MSEETIIENEIFDYGLLISKSGIHFADNSAIGFKTKSKIIEFDDITRRSKIKVVYSTEPKDAFLLKDDIDPLAIDSKYYDWIFEAEMVFEDEEIKPSMTFESSVKEALNHYNPYRKLIEIFENYGYFFPRKITFGHKLYRICNLIVKNNLPKQYTRWIDFNDSIEYNKILRDWDSLVRLESDFDTSYLASIDGDDILIDDIQEWLSLLKHDPDSSQVINWKELYPLYKILDEYQQAEIEFILGIDDQTEKIGIKERVLITGVVPVEASIYEYRVKFSDILSSSNYKMFGKLVMQNGKVIDLASIKFQSMNIFGFSVIIENFDMTKEFRNFQIVWMLIGLPSEIGFYSLDTRNIPILALNSYQFTCIEHSYIILKVPENLPENSIMCTNFIYPISDYETKFTASIQNYQDDEILIEISVNEENEKHHEPVNHGYESDVDNDESEIPKEIYNKESKYLIKCCIIFLSEDQTKKTPFLNKIGKPIHTSEKVDISNCPPIHTLDSTQINPVNIYDNPEENIDAMCSAID
ncbi:23063_t:CDS:2, partial [Gigaspora margarita]